MKSFATQIAIQAPAERIWQVLTDAANFAAWNTTVTRVDGTIAAGSRITVHTKASPGRAFPVKVTVFDAPRCMVWRGGMPLGLFTGERVYELTPHGQGAVAFSMRESFSGLLAPLIARSIPDLQPAFEEFARCLKTRAEGS